ncbi:hypothetical protein QWY20_11445 [Alkalimonas sp. MEB108]|uniref:Uncharacterized protein n=1 Tax=Alkalimonas cellulosilytica TaxID=3058395 RepID=A0ABU7J6D7_9GAMM|nr:hypothetical protein [Alkalimonas sp. MEB108]MEE2002068.1 hypothetical protein [Alkalimonas sp. MEB108]
MQSKTTCMQQAIESNLACDGKAVIERGWLEVPLRWRLRLFVLF